MQHTVATAKLPRFIIGRQASCANSYNPGREGYLTAVAVGNAPGISRTTDYVHFRRSTGQAALWRAPFATSWTPLRSAANAFALSPLTLSGPAANRASESPTSYLVSAAQKLWKTMSASNKRASSNEAQRAARNRVNGITRLLSPFETHDPNSAAASRAQSSSRRSAPRALRPPASANGARSHQWPPALRRRALRLSLPRLRCGAPPSRL
jgi:hypothetical protein